MKKRKVGIGFFFLGCIALAVLFSLFIQTPGAEPIDGQEITSAARPSLRLTESRRVSNDVIVEQIQAYDPTPLFLPTQWNISNIELPEVIQNTESVAFDDIPPHMVFIGENIPISFPINISTPKNSMDLLRIRHLQEIPLSLAQDDPLKENLQPRMAFLSIHSLSKESEEISTSLSIPESGEKPAALQANWQPMQFIAIITPMGLEGGLMTTNSSGIEEVDDYFRDYLTMNYRLGSKLSPGTYLLNVGP